MRLPVLLCCAVLLLTAAEKRRVTIDDLLAGHESVSISPVWSPDGSSFAYYKDAVVYRMKSGAAKPSAWFQSSQLEPAPAKSDIRPHTEPFGWRNRRVSEDTLQWLPDSKSIVFLENGSLYLAHEKGKPERIPLPAHFSGAQLSPDGKSILYSGADHNLYVFDLAASRSRQLTNDGSATLLNGELDWVYPEELDLGKAAWWSPDSSSIAFLQFDTGHEFLYPHADLLGDHAVSEPERYPQAGTPNARVRLGVLKLAAGRTQWMKAGNDPDVLVARVSWLPDSSAVAVELAPRIQNSLDLLFCDPSTGDTKTVIHESDKTWINIQDNLQFFRSRREFLWTSERSGFRHIYRYSLAGEQLAQLTSGDWEVRGLAAVDEANGRVYYLSAEDTPIETQLYAVDLEGKSRTRITAIGWDHRVSVEPNGHFFVDTYSNLKTPPETVLHSIDGQHSAVLYSRAKVDRAVQTTTPEIVQLKAPDGTLLYASLQKPVGYVEGHKYPVIVRVYGGPQAQSVRNAWHDLDMADVFTANGYAVWALDNRGSAGRGHGFEAAVYHNLGSVEVADQRAGVDYLIRCGIADRKRIGVTGWSYGGYMTIRCLLLAGDLFKAGAAGAPVTDWRNYDTIYTERYMGVPATNGAGYTASSNVGIAANLQGKLLIQHNLEDDNVLFQNTMQFVNALEEAGKQYSLQLYPFKTHGVAGHLRQPLDEAQLDFFNRNLQ